MGSPFFIDPAALPAALGGLVQVTFLGLAYGWILFTASNMIAEGSELLLLIPTLAGIVGPVVLPILGAVPDGAIVLFSGLGGNAQEELSVGVGALAGSTIMLLTVPWFFSIIGGRVDVKNGTPQYSKPRNAPPDWKKLSSENFSLTGCGVSGAQFVAYNGIILAITSIGYLVIQLPAFYATYLHQSEKQMRRFEHIYAGVGMVFCVVLFMGYLFYQLRQSQRGEDTSLDLKRTQLQIRAIKDMGLSLHAVVDELSKLRKGLTTTAVVVPPPAPPTLAAALPLGTEPLLIPPQNVPVPLRLALKEVLRPFFNELDCDRNGNLDVEEVRCLFYKLNEHPTESMVKALFHAFDIDQSSYIDLEEFVTLIVAFLNRPQFARGQSGESEKHGGQSRLNEEEEETEEIPEDFARLPPEKQQSCILRRAIYMMGLGTFLVLVFSDPMVDVMADLGRRTGIPSFYISFVLAPLASNASELFASYSYSLKKTKKSMIISFSSLLGAGSMNNTFCLAVFLGIIYFRRLVWTFSAETIAILVVEVVVALVAQKKVMTLLTGLLVLILYPLSLGLVYGLKRYAGME